AGTTGKVTLKVKVLAGALKSEGGEGKVVNGGDTATVKIGNDDEKKLEVVENPVPENPVKKEIDPYEGNGVLGGVNVDDLITYEISYKNYKNTAADITISDKLDKNVDYVSANKGGIYSVDDHIVTWKLTDVPAGEAGTVTLTVKVLEGALEKNAGPGKVVNGGNGDTYVKVGNDAEYILEAVENPVPEPEVPDIPEVPEEPEIPEKPEEPVPPVKKEITPYDGTGTLGLVKAGDEITYEISYTNYKKSAADIVISDKLDENVEFVSASDGGIYNGGTVVWTVKNAPAGTEGTVTLTVKVLESALESNGGPDKVVNGGDTSTVKVGDDPEYKLNLVENPVTESEIPEEPEIPDTPEPDTPIPPHKQEMSPYQGNGVLGEVMVGSQIIYEISYTNYKNEAADVLIIDKLDANVEFVSASDDGTHVDGVVTWKIAEVPAGQTGRVVLTVKVLEGALESKGGPGKVVNGGSTATVQVGNDDAFTLEEVENPVKAMDTESKRDDTPGETTSIRTDDSTPLGLLQIIMLLSAMGMLVTGGIIALRRKKK
ncbi:MAG: DUF11 domain-containing protein, partial [Eubacterium sp.]|nr:DUF11 domain-containing protein [Eubacterium sp.]